MNIVNIAEWFQPIWPILFVSAVAAIGAYLMIASWSDCYDRADRIMMLTVGTLGTAVISLLAFGAGAGLGTLIGYNSPQHWEPYWNANMVSMRSADGVHGEISGGLFVVSGFMDSRQVYFYYTQRSDGSYEAHHWTPDSNTYVYEEDRKDGTVIQYTKAFDHNWVKWFGFPSDDLKMDFHIPKGSLEKDFSLN